MKKLLLISVAFIGLCFPAVADTLTEPPKVSSLPKADFVCPSSRVLTTEEFDKTYRDPEDTFVKLILDEIDKGDKNSHIAVYFMFKTKTFVVVRFVPNDPNDLSKGLKSGCVLSEATVTLEEANLMAEEERRFVKFALDYFKNHDTTPDVTPPKDDGPLKLQDEPKDKSEE